MNAVSIPVQAVGGLSLDQAKRMPKYGAPLVVVGAPLVIDKKEFRASADRDELLNILRELVKKTKGSGE